MIYLESPKGVGFSYCDDAKSSGQCVNTDESTAQDAYEALVNFFKGFPEYKVTSESTIYCVLAVASYSIFYRKTNSISLASLMLEFTFLC